MDKLKKHALTAAMVLVALIILPPGVGKLAGVAQMHASFATLGLPPWFGYFIGACEVAGAVALFIQPLSALAAAGISVIALGAIYYHALHTPPVQGLPVLIVLLLCGFIIAKRRGQAAAAAAAAAH